MSAPDFERAWAALTAWLRAHAPESLAHLRAPAALEDMVALERAAGGDLPDEYRAFLARHDGEDDEGAFADAFLPVRRVLSTLEMHRGFLADGTYAPGPHGDDRAPDARLGPGWYRAGWLPVTGDGAGNALCLDLDPGPEGARGQVLEFRHDDAPRPVLAASLAGLIESRLRDLASGALVVCEYAQGGGYARITARARALDTPGLALRGEPREEYRARHHERLRRDPSWLVARVVAWLSRRVPVGDPLRDGFVPGPLRLREPGLQGLVVATVSAQLRPPYESAADLARELSAALRAHPDVLSMGEGERGVEALIAKTLAGAGLEF